MIRPERLTADIDGEFVVFLVGMRINKPLKIHKWWPVAMALPRMVSELSRNPELGFLHSETWFGRTTIMLQYWRSMDQLLSYAKDRNSAHLPAWKAFNQAIATSGDVGVWHETYSVRPGSYENIYVNMPPFGLGKVGNVQLAPGIRETASSSLHLDIP